MYYIYKIENLINHKKYIGLTNNIARRRARHFTDLRCHKHNNSFLQKEFDIYGQDNFLFTVEYQGEITEKEISCKEQEYIKKYDSYRNGYNQNPGGNFGASNGGTHLTQTDIYNILAALEFCSRPGAVLADIYDVSVTTISRIKKGENHIQYKEEYEKLPLSERKEIYKIFCESTNFYTKKINQTILQTKRHLTKEQVFMVLANYEYHVMPTKILTHKLKLKSDYSLVSIRDGKSYKDYKELYDKLNNEEKQKIVSLLREQ